MILRSYILIIAILGVNLLLICCKEKSQSNKDKRLPIVATDLEDTLLVNYGREVIEDACGACHRPWKTDNLLAGIVERVGVDYLRLYITKQDSLLAAKNTYALEIKSRFGNLASVHNYDLSNEQLNAIIAYLKKYSP